MKLIFSTLLVIVLPCAAVSGQAAPAPQPPTFHFKGTITDPLDAGIKEAKVTFRNEPLSTAVNTNDVGGFEDGQALDCNGQQPGLRRRTAEGGCSQMNPIHVHD